MMRIGTASWADNSRIDSRCFYPPAAISPEDRRCFYALQFSLIEEDSACYAMSATSVSPLWAKRTPTSFAFNLNTFRRITGHQTPLATFPKDLRDAPIWCRSRTTGIRAVSKQAKGVPVLFNNNDQNQGQRHARALMRWPDWRRSGTPRSTLSAPQHASSFVAKALQA